jgi:hypothetical protein
LHFSARQLAQRARQRLIISGIHRLTLLYEAICGSAKKLCAMRIFCAAQDLIAAAQHGFYFTDLHFFVK